MGKNNILIKLATWVLFAIFARTAEGGANTYTTALERGDEIHGEMWKNDRLFEVGPMLSTDEVKKFGDKMSREVDQVMLKADAGTKAFLS